MLKLDQSGLLDKALDSDPNQPKGTLWWAKRLYMETVNSLADLQLTDHPPSPPGNLIPEGKVSELPKDSAVLSGEATVSSGIRFSSTPARQASQEAMESMVENSSLEKSSTKTSVDISVQSLSSSARDSETTSPKLTSVQSKSARLLNEPHSRSKSNDSSGVEPKGKVRRASKNLISDWSRREKIERQDVCSSSWPPERVAFLKGSY